MNRFAIGWSRFGNVDCTLSMKCKHKTKAKERHQRILKELKQLVRE